MWSTVVANSHARLKWHTLQACTPVPGFYNIANYAAEVNTLLQVFLDPSFLTDLQAIEWFPTDVTADALV